MPISFDNIGFVNNDYNRYGVSEPAVKGSTDNPQTAGETIASGTTVTGEIVDKEGDQVTILLGGDRTISARLQGNADIEVGMRLTFEVAKGQGGQTALRPLFSNLANNSAVMSALKAAGLPVNNTTMVMTDRMMQEGMPVNRNALTDMFRNVSMHRSAPPETIVQMTKLGMPLTELNITQYENYRNFEHQISGNLQNVSDAVSELFKEALDVATSSSDKTAVFDQMQPLDVIKEVLDLVDTENLETIMPEESDVILASEEEATGPEATFNNNLSLTPAEQQTLTSDLQNILILAGEASDIHEPLDPSQIMTAVKELTSQYPPSDLIVMEAETEKYSEETSEGKDEAALNEVAKNDIALLKDAGKTSPEGSQQPSGTAGEENASSEKAIGLAQDQNIADAGNPAVKAKTIRHEITEKLTDLLKSDGFSKLLKDSVKAQMSIKPEDVSKNGKIDELYDKIQKTSSKITQLMEDIGRADAPAAKAAGALTDNVNFMNQLNEFVSYVQLPLKMAGEDANGELYVYTNKKNLSDRDGNYSALLHLDMEHLGPMDIYVTMRDHTKVSTNFYLQSEELLDFIGEHIDELTKRLADKGYDTSTRVTKKDPGQPITPVTDEFTKDEAKAESHVVISKMRFDVRA